MKYVVGSVGREAGGVALAFDDGDLRAVVLGVERIVHAVVRGDPDHVGDLAELVELGEAGVVEADAVDHDEAVAAPHDRHVAAEPDRQRAGQADRAGDEEQVGQDLDELAVGIRGRMCACHRATLLRLHAAPVRAGLSDPGVTPGA